jgi:hypothetical protein
VAAADHAVNPREPHQSGHLVPADIKTGMASGVPQLAGTVDAPLLLPQREQRVGQVGILELGFGDRLSASLVVGRRRDQAAVLGQHGADRLDAEPGPVGLDVVDDHLSRRSSSA